uniref:Uncharacterized protein n=1 Tax=Anguilla anguilla TaxID=7936 RepID=A0A0E9VNL7_ANGAN
MIFKILNCALGLNIWVWT